jgi:hypothetical protein
VLNACRTCKLCNHCCKNNAARCSTHMPRWSSNISRIVCSAQLLEAGMACARCAWPASYVYALHLVSMQLLLLHLGAALCFKLVLQ